MRWSVQRGCTSFFLGHRLLSGRLLFFRIVPFPRCGAWFLGQPTWKSRRWPLGVPQDGLKFGPDHWKILALKRQTHDKINIFHGKLTTSKILYRNGFHFDRLVCRRIAILVGFFLFMLFHSYPHITTFRRLRALKPQHQIDQIGYRSNLGPSPPKWIVSMLLLQWLTTTVGTQLLKNQAAWSSSWFRPWEDQGSQWMVITDRLLDQH